MRALLRHPTVRNAMLFLAVLGPGIITGSVDNDAGGITTYSVAGAEYGYGMLWTLLPSFLVLVIVQEMNARMGLVTGKGLADLIRENFGLKITFYLFIFLLVANIGNTATEFAGIAGSLNLFHISKYLSVPLAALSVWIFLLKGNYRIAEKVFLVFSLFLLSYVVSAVLAKPDWGNIGIAMVHPSIEWNWSYLSMVMGIVGTTIAPWMQFYMQAAVIEKGLKPEDYRFTMWDVVVGSVLTVVVAFFIIVACGSTLHSRGIHIGQAGDAAMAFEPLAGELAAHVFAFGLFIASVFSAAILPISTAFFVCEAFGFESGINKKFREAPQFYSLITFIIALSAGVVLIPGAPLIALTLWTQVANGVLLPAVLICMIKLTSNPKVMGGYVNNRLQNRIGWLVIVALILMSVLLLLAPAAQRLLAHLA